MWLTGGGGEGGMKQPDTNDLNQGTIIEGEGSVTEQHTLKSANSRKNTKNYLYLVISGS